LPGGKNLLREALDVVFVPRERGVAEALGELQDKQVRREQEPERREREEKKREEKKRERSKRERSHT
jgi:hypothetical protein